MLKCMTKHCVVGIAGNSISVPHNSSGLEELDEKLKHLLQLQHASKGEVELVLE